MKTKIRVKGKMICVMLASIMLVSIYGAVKISANENDGFVEFSNEGNVTEEECVSTLEEIEKYDLADPVEVKPTKSVKSTTTIDLNNYVVNAPVTGGQVVLKAYDSNYYLKKAGTNRGDNMVRELIPFEIKAGESVTLKQVGGKNQSDIVVDLESGLASTDVYATLSKSGSSLTATAIDTSLIYVRIPRTTFTDITIEYSISKGTSLPIYTQNISSQDMLFAEWDTLGTKFCVLQNDITFLQVPTKNKEMLRNIKNYGSFNNIDEILQYYVDMLDFFDYSYGLDGSTDYNYKPRHKYLTTPEYRDGTGIGAAYWPTIVRCYGTRGMSPMFEDTWLSKHEYAHGYQGNFMDNDVSIKEIWNNIPTHYFSMETNTNLKTYKPNYTKVKPSNQQKMYERYVKVRDTGLEAAYSLEFFREIFDQYGLEPFIKFNQEYRRLSYTGGKKDTNTNMFSELFSRYAGVDLSPYFISQGFNVKDYVVNNNYELPNVFYLTELTANEETLNYVINKCNLVTKYSIVDTSIFATDENLKGIVGSATINIDIDDSKQLKGKQVLIKNGDTEYLAKIDGNVARFENVPVGVYKLGMPLSVNGDYLKTGDKYIVVREGKESLIDIKYGKVNDNLLNLEYTFNIRNDDNLTPLYADLSYVSDNNYKLTIGTLADRCNPKATVNSVYGYFKVYDENDNLLENYELYNLIPTVASSKDITVKKGYTIEMYRAGMPERKLYRSNITKKDYYDNNVNLMTFKITDNGVIYLNGVDNTKEIMEWFVANNTDAFSKTTQYTLHEKSVYLKSAIDHLNNDNKKTYSENYKAILRNSNPVIAIPTKNVLTNVGIKPNYLEKIRVTDFEDGDLINSVVIDDSAVNLDELGVYHVKLKVFDSDHNYTEKEMNVEVVDYEIIEDETEEIPSGNPDETEEVKEKTGNLSVVVEIDDVTQLKGKQLRIKKDDVEYFAKIDGNTASFDNVPVGVYKLGTPSTINGNYTKSEQKFVTIIENNVSHASVKYVPVKDNLLNLDYTFNIRTDLGYTPLHVELSYLSDNNYNLKIGTLDGRLNSSASTNALYGYFRVYDENNNRLENYEFYNLTPSVASMKNITVKKGYTIEMYRSGMRKWKVYKSNLIGKEYTDTNNDLMTFKITDNGLECLNATHTTTKEILDAYITKNSSSISSASQYEFTDTNAYLKTTINHLTADNKSLYEQTYKNNIKSSNPVIVVPNDTITTEFGVVPNYLENVQATDFEDGNISNVIIVDDSQVDLNKAGEYIVTFYVLDSDHNYDVKEMAVQVSETKTDIIIDETEETEEDEFEEETDGTEDGTEEVTDGTEDGTEEVTDGTEDGTEEETDGTEDGTEEETDGTEDGAEEVTDGTEDGTEEETDGTEDGTEEETDGTEDGAEEVTDGTEDGTEEETDGTEDGAEEETDGTEDGTEEVTDGTEDGTEEETDGTEDGAEEVTDGTEDGTEEETDGTEDGTEEVTDGTEDGTEEETDGTEEGTEEETDGTEDGTEEVTDGTEDGAEEVTEGTEDGTEEVTDGIEEGTEEETDGTEDGTEEVTDGTVDGTEEVADGTEDGTEEVTDGTEDGTEEVTDGTEDGTEEVTDGTEDGTEEVTDGTEDGTEEETDGTEDGTEEVTDGTEDGTEEETDGTEDGTEEVTDGTEDGTEEVTDGTEDGTEEETDGTEEGTEEETDGTEDGTEEVTDGTEDGTEEVTDGTDDGTEEETDGTEDGTEEVTDGTEDGTEEVTEGTEDGTEEVTDGTEDGTEEVTDGTEEGTEEVTDGTEDGTEEVTDGTEDGTEKVDDTNTAIEDSKTDDSNTSIENPNTNNNTSYGRSLNSSRRTKPSVKSNENKDVTSKDTKTIGPNISSGRLKTFDISQDYDNVSNKNSIIPFYYDENNKKQYMMFSSLKDGKIVYIEDDINGREIQIEPVESKNFKDVDNSWAKESIEFVSNRDILTGISNSEFAPNHEVSRAMIVTVLGRLSNAETNSNASNFDDVADGLWYSGYVSWAKENGIVNGIDDSHFSPNANITREQLAVVIENYLSKEGFLSDQTIEVDEFDDYTDISSWAKNSVSKLNAIGLLNGDTKGNFNPKDNLTRAELSSIIERLVEYSINCLEQ